MNLKDNKKKKGFLASLDIIIKEYKNFLRRVGNL